jgi:hypothetical protein
MVTSHSYTQYREKCETAGADYFFNKTKDFEDIRRMLAGIAGGAGLRTEDSNEEE